MMQSTKPSARVKRHGPWLLGWIILLLLSSIVAALSNFGALLYGEASALQSVTGLVPKWALFLSGLLSVANILHAILLLRWKVWGLYAVAVVSVIMFFINVSIGVDILWACTGFVGPAALYFFMYPKWTLFE